jgi:hypothetical protein
LGRYQPQIYIFLYRYLYDGSKKFQNEPLK